MALISKSYRFDIPVVGNRAIVVDMYGYSIAVYLHAFTTGIYLVYEDGLYDPSEEMFMAIRIWLDNFMMSVSLEEYILSVQIVNPKGTRVYSENEI